MYDYWLPLGTIMIILHVVGHAWEICQGWWLIGNSGSVSTCIIFVSLNMVLFCWKPKIQRRQSLFVSKCILQDVTRVQGMPVDSFLSFILPFKAILVDLNEFPSIFQKVQHSYSRHQKTISNFLRITLKGNLRLNKIWPLEGAMYMTLW